MHRDVCGRWRFAVAIAVAKSLRLGIAVTYAIADTHAVTNTKRFGIAECVAESNAVKWSARNAACSRIA